MAKMRAVQVSKAGGALELVEREVPAPGAGQVRIRVEACGVCHSDALVKSGAFPGLTLPRVPGHEIAGRIDAVGPTVTVWKPGDRVGVGWHGGHCFVCTPCRKGLFINCEREQITGITFDGGYAEYTVVPQEAVARMPAELGATEAAPLLCAGITTFNALRNSGARPGDTVAVQGIGGLGHLAIQFAARMGFRTVALSHGADKEELARGLGAHVYVDSGRRDAAEALRELGGADLVLATAPHAAAIASTVGGLKPRGKLLVVAAPSEAMEVSVFTLLSGKAVAGWPSGSSIDSEETLAFSALTGVRPRVELFPLEQAEQAFQKMLQNRVRFRAVLTL
ncbi:MAG TPA: alcohol dehydrogenase [Anaeromyxobacteraceae bacterium]|nr:alcohol dehydrogenase [Anaeromyxobacteraceae bacterium]